MLSSLNLFGQVWVASGTSDIINNNPGGGVRIFQTFTTIPPSSVWPLFAYGSTGHTSGTASSVWGAYLLSLNTKAGTLTESIGATITTGNESSGNGTVTTAYAIRARVQAGLGTVNTGYGVYVDNTAATNDYGIYQVGTDDTNYFGGNVGIGTTNPATFKLAVEGKIGAREVVVTNAAWADYVFDATYNLRPLSEVESFIKINKHLPEIPSAEEVKTNGHKLGEMDVLLLKKVEELTLYLIEQEKRIKELESKK
jgi:hypothetical protein